MMSMILASSTPAPASQPAEVSAQVLAVLGAFSALSLAIAWAAGVWRPCKVRGPSRLMPDDSTARFFALALIAVAGAFASHPAMYALLPFLPEHQRNIIAGGMAMAVAAVVLLVAVPVAREGGLGLLGLRGRGLLRGIVAGIVGLLIMLPWLFWLALGVKLMLDHLGIEAPTDHDVFRIWHRPDSDALFRVLAVAMAVVAAPLAEELLLRGVVQTGLSWLFAGGRFRAMAVKAPAAPPQPVEPTPDSPEPTQPPLLTAPAALPPDWPPTAARWAAIVTTSLLFALLHTPWPTRIPIFVLSLGLGYLYERTANLWACIFMHAFFNAVQISIFVLAGAASAN